MTIELISFQGGLPFSRVREVDQAIADGQAAVKCLTPGEYDLTPNIWKKPAYRYNLLVHEDGTATFRSIPNYPGSISTTFSSENKGLDVKQGGRNLRLPQDTEVGMVVGPISRDDLTIRVFEIIVYRNGGK